MSCFRGGGCSSEPAVKTERVQDQKEKMQAELQALWKEQCDQLRRKKEQFATEVSGTQEKSALLSLSQFACNENMLSNSLEGDRVCLLTYDC